MDEETQRRPYAIVGASARAAAFSAIRAGLGPITADLFADADLAACGGAVRVERYPHGLLDWLRTTPPETFWMYTGALENYPELVDTMAAVRQLLGCGGEVLRRVRDPLVLAKLLAEADVAFPEIIALRTPLPLDSPHRLLSPLPLDGGGVGCGGERTMDDAVTDGDTAAWLLKTCRGSSGSGVRVWDARRPHNSSDSAVLQRRVDGTSGSAVFVGDGGWATLLGITRQLVGMPWTHAGAFQYAGSIGPWHLEGAAESEIQRAGNAIAGAGVAGLFGIDFVLGNDDGRPYVVEVNPRYTASVEVVERLMGTSALAMHLQSTAGSRLSPAPPAPPPSRGRGERDSCGAVRGRGERDSCGAARGRGDRSVFGKAILFAPQDVTVTQAFADWTQTKTTGPPWPELADLPHAGTTIPPGRPVLTVFADGISYAEVERLLQAGIEEVEQRLA